MRIAFAVLCLFITYVVSFPSLNEYASDDEDFDLELRSMLNNMENEQVARALEDDDDAEDESDIEESSFSKRNKKINPGLECEIKCVHAERHPTTGKGKSVKEAARICKKRCPTPTKRPGKKPIVQRKHQPHLKATREFIDDDDSNSSEEQQAQRRELYNYLMEQLQENNSE